MRDNGTDEKLEYDVRKRAKAGTSATFRAVVAIYVMYLGSNLCRSTADGTSTLPPWAGWLSGIFFILAGLAFGIYTWNRYRIEKEAARLPETDEENEAEYDGDDADE